MEAVRQRKITRIVALWAVLALIAALSLVWSSGNDDPSGDQVRRLGGSDLLSHTVPSTFDLDSYGGGAFTGSLGSAEGACESDRFVTVFIDDAVGSAADTPVANGGSAGALNPGEWTAGVWVDPPGIQTYYAVLASNPFTDLEVDSPHTCGAATSNTLSI
jgi:hypothetical protein